MAKHRTGELEGTSGPLSPTLCSNLGHLEQIVQGHVWSGLGCLWGWRFHSHSRQPVPVFDHLYLEFPLFQHVHIASVHNWVALSYNSVDDTTAPSTRTTSFGGAWGCPCSPKKPATEIAATVMWDFSPQQFPEGSSAFWWNWINNSFDTIDITQDELSADGVGARSITTQEQCDSPWVLKLFLCSQRVGRERKTKWASGTGVTIHPCVGQETCWTLAPHFGSRRLCRVWRSRLSILPTPSFAWSLP